MNAIGHVENINQIVQGTQKLKGPPISVPGLPPGCVASHEITFLTVDSGACDSIAPSGWFPNTKITCSAETGRTYGACGGETVTNLGAKSARCLFSNKDLENNPVIKTFNMQIGDLISRGLLAVSQICAMGAGVWFGPGPAFKSYITWNPET